MYKHLQGAIVFISLAFLFAPWGNFAYANTSCTTSSKTIYWDATGNPVGHLYPQDTTSAACYPFLDGLSAYIGSTVIVSGSSANDGTYIVHSGTTLGDVYFTTGVVAGSDATGVTFTLVTGGGLPPQQFSTTTQLVDNPNQDYFNGVLLFFMSLVGVLWWFKKR